MRPWWPSTAAKMRWRHSQAVWRVARHVSAAAPGGTLSPMGLTKPTQAASSFPQRSSTVPVSESNRVPQLPHRCLRSPDSPQPSLDGSAAPQPGRAGPGR